MSERIIYKEKDEELFWQYWQKLIDNKQAGYNYLKTFLEQSIAVLKGRHLFCGDKSFVYLLNNEPVAGAFLPIEEVNGNLAISINGDFVKAPLFNNDKIQKKIFSISYME